MVTETGKWNVAQYSKFLDERTRPAAELLARVEIDNPVEVVDLGCGPGNSTGLLIERWSKAHVVGVDNSDEMLASARNDYPALQFELADISSWKSASSVDVLFSNAAYQWVPDHKTLFPQLASQIRTGGFFAMQVPHNHERPTHRSMREVAAENTWSADLSKVRHQPPVLEAGEYYNILAPLMDRIDIWETEYFHVLASIDDIVEWLKGTGLKPFLKPLPEAEQKRFLELYREKLSVFITPRIDGKVLLPFPRLFVVARRKACS